ncbi:MAG: FGGY family carbohydrate kinase, partial [Eubacterium callanderi]
MGKYVLVIDEGTTGTRALIFDSDFNIAAQAYQEFTQYTPQENMVEHDAMEIYAKSVGVCREAIEKAGLSSDDIACMGITNQRNTCVIWDKNTGEPLYNAIVWQDSRTGQAVDAIKQTEWAEKILQETGKVIAPHNNALIIKWYMDNVPEIKEKIDRGEALYGTMDTWMIWKLSGGKIHAVSCSNASSSGCIDLRTGEWHKEFLDYV